MCWLVRGWLSQFMSLQESSAGETQLGLDPVSTMAHLCLSSWGWPLAGSSNETVAGRPWLFFMWTSLWDRLCFLTAWWIGSKNKCSKT